MNVWKVSGLVGTFFAPRLVRSQGVLSALLLSQVQQWACLAVSVALFHAHDSVASAHVDGDSSGATMVAAFLACLCGSRVGLWSSDLAQLQVTKNAAVNKQHACPVRTHIYLSIYVCIYLDWPTSFYLSCVCSCLFGFACVYCIV